LLNVMEFTINHDNHDICNVIFKKPVFQFGNATSARQAVTAGVRLKPIIGDYRSFKISHIFAGITRGWAGFCEVRNHLNSDCGVRNADWGGGPKSKVGGCGRPGASAQAGGPGQGGSG
jgi:hypothetical protein